MDFLLLRGRGSWEPNADVVIDEEAKLAVARVELAGVDSDNLRVFADERFLFIVGRRAETVRLRNGSFLQKEIADGEFVKRIRLPVRVAHADVSATYADGMLTIALPIAAAQYASPARTEIRMTVKRILV